MTQSEKLIRTRGIAGVSAEVYTLMGYLQTTDATTTTILTIEVPEKSSAAITVRGTGRQNDFTDRLIIVEHSGWYRASGGNITAHGTSDRYQDEDSGGAPTVTISASAPANVLVQVAGIAAETWNWLMSAEVVLLTTP